MPVLNHFLQNSTFDSNRQKVGLTIYYFHTYASEDDVTSSNIRDLFELNDIPMSRSVIAGHIQNLKDENLVSSIARPNSRGCFLTPKGIKKFERLAGENSTTSTSNQSGVLGLDEALNNGETERVEFKEEIPDSKREIPKEAIALANKRGGILAFGIGDNNNSIVGLSDIDGTERLVENLLRDNVQPKLNFSIEKETRNGDDILILEVPPAEELPRNMDGIHYTRIGTSVRKLSSPELREWFTEA